MAKKIPIEQRRKSIKMNNISLKKHEREKIFNVLKGKYLSYIDANFSFREGKIYGIWDHGFRIKDAEGIRHKIYFNQVRGIYLDGAKDIPYDFKKIVKEILRGEANA